MLKKIILCALSFIFIFACAAYSLENVAGDVIVVLKPSSSEEKITAASLNNLGSEAFRVASFAAESQAWVKNIYPSLSEAGNSVYALLHSESRSAEELVQELLKNPDVLAASTNYKVYNAVMPDDSYINECWGIDFLNMSEAWEISTGSSDVYVAVIDSGIDYDNPDLIDNIDFEYSKTFVKNTTSAADDNGHGTHVSGTIGAVGNNGMGVAGINWNVKLIALKSMQSSGYGEIADIISAIDYVTSLIKSGVNIKVLNMSLEAYAKMTPTYDNLVREPLWRAMKALDELNKVVTVVAAGNHGQVVGSPSSRGDGSSSVPGAGYYVYPASFEGLNNMISVSALSADGTVASFSNSNADMAAPGVNILSTWLQSSKSDIRDDGTSLYSTTGTSMAAPHVAGAAALLASIMPDRTAYQIKNAMLGINSASGAAKTAAYDTVLNVKAAIDFQEANSADMTAEPPASEYDDYKNYDGSSSGTSTSGGGGGGGCNGTGAGIFVIMILLPLVKKKRS